MVSFADEVTVFQTKKKSNVKDYKKYSKKIKSESMLKPTIKDNIVLYDFGLLKVNFVYQAILYLPHNFGNKINFKDNIKQTSNITVMDIEYKNDGHYITIHIHPQKPLKMNDYLDITFKNDIKSKNNNNNMDMDGKDQSGMDMDVNESNNNDININGYNETIKINKNNNNDTILNEDIKLILTGNVLRKNQGMPLLTTGIIIIRSSKFIDTDIDTEWEGFK